MVIKIYTLKQYVMFSTIHGAVFSRAARSEITKISSFNFPQKAACRMPDGKHKAMKHYFKTCTFFIDVKKLI